MTMNKLSGWGKVDVYLASQLQGALDDRRQGKTQ